MSFHSLLCVDYNMTYVSAIVSGSIPWRRTVIRHMRSASHHHLNLSSLLSAQMTEFRPEVRSVVCCNLPRLRRRRWHGGAAVDRWLRCRRQRFGRRRRWWRATLSRWSGCPVSRACGRRRRWKTGRCRRRLSSSGRLRLLRFVVGEERRRHRGRRRHDVSERRRRRREMNGTVAADDRVWDEAGDAREETHFGDVISHAGQMLF